MERIPADGFTTDSSLSQRLSKLRTILLHNSREYISHVFQNFAFFGQFLLSRSRVESLSDQ